MPKVNTFCVCCMQSINLSVLTSSNRNFSSESDITVILSSRCVTASDVVFLLDPQSENVIPCSWADVQCRDQDSMSGIAKAGICIVLRLIYY